MLLEVKDLAFARQNKYLFRNLNFSLSAGELIHIQGHNGAGKSSLLKILAGLLIPNKGDIRWCQQAIASNTDYLSSLSYLDHKNGLKLALSPEENVRLQLSLADSELCITKVQASLRAMKIPLKPQACSELSAGGRRKLALTALVLKRKALWLVDEPTTGLDSGSAACFAAFLKTHLNDGGMVVMVSHLPIPVPVQKTLVLSQEEN